MSEVITRITRDNLEELLDHRMIDVKVANASGPTKPDVWWNIRRNSTTWRGVKHPHRFKISIKAGLRWYSKITEKDITADGTLDPRKFRLKPPV